MKRCSNAKESLSSRGTQWPVEPSGPVHVLSVFRLLLFPNPVDLVSRNLCVLGAPEAGEAHSLAHLCLDAVVVFVLIHVHLVRFVLLF